jgi:hypothetical protein
MNKFKGATIQVSQNRVDLDHFSNISQYTVPGSYMEVVRTTILSAGVQDLLALTIPKQIFP